MKLKNYEVTLTSEQWMAALMALNSQANTISELLSRASIPDLAEQLKKDLTATKQSFDALMNAKEVWA